MSFIHFFEKPGCINGEKQKRILMEAGNTLECINILEHPWSREELSQFCAVEDPTKIMNYTAPAIKSGEIVPEKLTYERAIMLMIENPILIKRPLIEVDGTFIQGFMDARLTPYLGAWTGEDDVVTCPNLLSLSCDDKNKIS